MRRRAPAGRAVWRHRGAQREMNRRPPTSLLVTSRSRGGSGTMQHVTRNHLGVRPVSSATAAAVFTPTPGFLTAATFAPARTRAGATWSAASTRASLSPDARGAWTRFRECAARADKRSAGYSAYLPFVDHRYGRSATLDEPVVALSLYELVNLATGCPRHLPRRVLPTGFDSRRARRHRQRR